MSLKTPMLFSEVADSVTCNGYGDCVSLLREPDAANPHDFITMLTPSTRVDFGCMTTKAREKGANMIIMGVDFHPSFQQIAFMDQETGECGDRRLNHSDGEAERFYKKLKERGVSVRVGLEATGYSRWFERLLAELGFEVWIGDAAEIKRQRGRKQKTDREDARLLLRLLLENRFPRIWTPNPENRDLRQLLWHRHRLVQMRTRIMNQLQAVAMNEGYRWKKKLFSEKGRALLEKLSLAPWASRRRKELLELLDQLDPKIAELTAALEQEGNKRPEVVLLKTHPGVGPLTGLAYVLVIGTPDRFPCGKKIGSYTGLIPSEDSSAGHQRLGHISKQGNALLRYLLGEAAQAAARCNPDWRRRYTHLMMRREKRIAKVAMARKLAVRLYWMWRNNWQYSQLVEFGSNAGKLGTGHGVK
jgi:transposase